MQNAALLEAFIFLFCCTGFIKISTVLNIFSYGIGLRNSGFSLVIFFLSLILSIFIAEPMINSLGGIDAIFSKNVLSNNFDLISPFLSPAIDPDISAALGNMDSNYNLIVAYVLSGLKIAFITGFAILLPFLLIDILVANVLAALCVSQISVAIISLPLKILLFVSLDGWLRITEKLLTI